MMKVVKTASGKQTLKLSKKDWLAIGEKTGWLKAAGPFLVHEGDAEVAPSPTTACKGCKAPLKTGEKVCASCGKPVDNRPNPAGALPNAGRMPPAGVRPVQPFEDR
jgi:hypothetical protein